MKKGKRLLCGVLALLLVLSLTAVATVQRAYATKSEEEQAAEEQKKAEEAAQRQAEMDELERKKQEKKDRIAALQKQIADAKSKKEDVMGTKTLLDQRNQLLMEEIDDTKAQIDLYATQGNAYSFLFITKGGGSANKTFLYQQTKALLNEKSLTEFIKTHIMDLGTAACPPYHLAIVIGGTSAEANLSTVKKASAGYLDHLPTSGNEGGRAFRDLEWEQKVLKICQESGVGAQFGGKYLVHDVRVVRLPRHAASCPVGIGVSCSADRNIKAKITADGIFLEQLEKNPARFLPKEAPNMQPAVELDLDEGMDKVRETLSKYPVKTRFNVKGTLVVARDIAHARIKQMIDEGKPMPEYFKKHPIYYAGPAKTPQGMASGSFGPTTAGRMDPYVDLFQSLGGSLVMVAKGNRSQAVTDACKKHGGFYLGSIGGPAAVLAKDSIKSVEVVDFPELGMEAVRKIYVENFPAFLLVDDKGNDFFAAFKK